MNKHLWILLLLLLTTTTTTATSVSAGLEEDQEEEESKIDIDFDVDQKEQQLEQQQQQQQLYCSELKCRSIGFYGGYDCWGTINNTNTNTSSVVDPIDPIDPMLCEDGYKGVPLLSIPPILVNDDDDDDNDDPTELFENNELGDDNPTLYYYYYYTCCPDNGDGEDKTSNDINTINNININTTAISLYGQPQCSPYHGENVCDDSWNDCIADAPLEPMTCNQEQKYKYPNKNSYKVYYNSWYYSQYQCCLTPLPSPESDEQSEQHSTILLYGLEITRLGLSLIALIVSGSLILSILFAKRTTRTKAFNLYIVFLTIPDVISNCILNIIFGSFFISQQYLQITCPLISFGAFWYSTVNLWLNSIILFEVHTLLKKSKQRQRTNPPTMKRVLIQTLIVNLYAFVIGIWGIYLWCNQDFIITTTELGIYQILLMITWIFIALIPFGYLIYICYHFFCCCKRRNRNNNQNQNQLLPRNGRTRVLCFFILRVVISYTLFWTTTFVLISLMPQNLLKLNGVHYMIWFLGPIESIVNTIFSLTKPDIKQAYIQFWTCRRCCGNNDNIMDNNNNSRNNNTTSFWNNRDDTSTLFYSRFFDFASVSDNSNKIFEWFLCGGGLLRRRNSKQEEGDTNTTHGETQKQRGGGGEEEEAGFSSSYSIDFLAEESNNNTTTDEEEPNDIAALCSSSPKNHHHELEDDDDENRSNVVVSTVSENEIVFHMEDSSVEEGEEEERGGDDEEEEEEAETEERGLFDTAIPGGIWDQVDDWSSD